MNVVEDILFLITVLIVVGLTILSLKRMIELLIARHYEKQYRTIQQDCKKIKEEIEEENNERLYKS